MTRKLETTKWTVSGINLTPSDDIYQKLVIELKKGIPTQDHLQKITGHNAPIEIDERNKTIEFLSC